MMIPSNVSKGEPLRASWLQQLLASMRSLRLLPGVGYRIKRTANGTVLEIDTQNQTGERFRFPWEQLSFGYTLSDGNTVYIHPGKLYLPWGLAEAYGEVELTGGPTEYVYVECERGDTEYASIGHQTTYPQTAGNLLRYALFSFELVEEDVYKRVGIHNLGDIHADASEPDSE